MAKPRKSQTATKAPTQSGDAPRSDPPSALPEPEQQQAAPVAVAMPEGVISTEEPSSEEPRPGAEKVADTSAEAPKTPAPAARPKDVRPAPQRSAFWPMLAGGVLSAGIGAGAALYLLPDGWRGMAPVQAPDNGVAEMAVRMDALEADLAKVRSDGATAAFVTSGLRDVAGRIDSVRAGLAAEVSAAVAAGQAATDQLAGLDARLSEVEKRPVEGGAASATALEAFEREMQQMRALLQESAAASTAVAGDIAAKAADAEAMIAAAEAEAARLKGEAEAAGRKAMGRAAVSQLQAAFDSGAPIEPGLTVLGEAGVETPEGFRDTLAAAPSLQFLRDSFPDAARAALSATLRVGAEDTGTMGKIGAFLRSQTGARSLEPRAGDDPDAILSRAEAALTAGALPDALAEIAALPPEGQEAMAEWVSGAEARLAAGAALADLSAAIN